MSDYRITLHLVPVAGETMADTHARILLGQHERSLLEVTDIEDSGGYRIVCATYPGTAGLGEATDAISRMRCTGGFPSWVLPPRD